MDWIVLLVRLGYGAGTAAILTFIIWLYMTLGQIGVIGESVTIGGVSTVRILFQGVFLVALVFGLLAVIFAPRPEEWH